MPFVCAFVCGPKPQKKKAPNNKTMDFRRADPNYVNFVPRTCVDAIDLFNRHRNLGMAASIFPECFVHCARALPDEELDKFHRFIVAPGGDIETGGEKPTPIDLEIEKERKRLLAECEAREPADCPGAWRMLGQRGRGEVRVCEETGDRTSIAQKK